MVIVCDIRKLPTRLRVRMSNVLHIRSTACMYALRRHHHTTTAAAAANAPGDRKLGSLPHVNQRWSVQWR
jgi:hypothetical protein